MVVTLLRGTTTLYSVRIRNPMQPIGAALTPDRYFRWLQGFSSQFLEAPDYSVGPMVDVGPIYKSRGSGQIYSSLCGRWMVTIAIKLPT